MMVVFARLSPYSIKVIPRKISAIITIIYTIHIDHWDDIILKILLPTIVIVLHQPFHNPLGDV